MDPQSNSWGRIDRRDRSSEPFDSSSLGTKPSWLPYGNGRSYGDTCHNNDGVLLHGQHLSSILSFDEAHGVIRVQSGLLLADLLSFLSDKKWFPAVVPGTRHVTIGGALANDIHGKNHGKMGTFGQHVRSFILERSNGSKLQCSAIENSELFNATIGGMGLTGFVKEIELALMPVASHWVESRNIPFENLSTFFEINGEAEANNHYNVAWLDSLKTGDGFGRGIMIVGNHAAHYSVPNYKPAQIAVPFTPPIPLVAGVPLRIFNDAYFWSKSRNTKSIITSPESFFFPLDAIGGWNRLYGPRGLYQHQSVIPETNAQSVIGELLRTSQRAGAGSFLTVLKRFGAANSPGLMSFPIPGYTLTLDFPNRGARTADLLNRLDEITLCAGGRVNPYKDQRMSAATFQAGFPHWEKLEARRDPSVNSDFWIRTTKRKVLAAPSLEPSANRTAVNQAHKQDVQKASISSDFTGDGPARKHEST